MRIVRLQLFLNLERFEAMQAQVIVLCICVFSVLCFAPDLDDVFDVIRRFSRAVGGVLQCATQRPHLHTPLAPGINASASRLHFLSNAGLADIAVYVFLWEPRPQTVQILEGTILVAVGSIRLQLLAAQTLSLVSSVLHKPSSSESSGLLRSSTLSLAGRGEKSVELLLRSSHEMERLLHVSTRSTSIVAAASRSAPPSAALRMFVWQL